MKILIGLIMTLISFSAMADWVYTCDPITGVCQMIYIEIQHY